MFVSSWRKIVAAAALCAMAFAVSAQDARVNDVAVELFIQGTPRPDAPVKLMVSITNESDVPLALPARPGWDEAGGLEILVSDGKQAAREVNRENTGRKPAATPGQATMTLQPGESYAVMRSLSYAQLAGASASPVVQVVYRRPGLRDVTSAPVELVKAGAR